MKFIDEARISVRSGDGGAGSVHFMRMAGMPRMGPDGGNGGKGGDVYFEATNNMQSLLDFKFKSIFHAENGVSGGGAHKDGRFGDDIIIKVPVGTQLYTSESSEFIADLVEEGKRVLLCRGGRGGLGNMNFATPTRQAPDFAQPGESGKSYKVKLVLKLIADVALVGFPNAGKSSLISKVSAAKPKIGDYPFTTLTPNLGVVRAPGIDFVLADIPGLIEGASEGKGLGTRFLKHCQRSRFITYILDPNPHTGLGVVEQFKALSKELKNHSEELFQKPRLLCINKTDAFADQITDEIIHELKEISKAEEVLKISAVSGEGTDTLIKLLSEKLNTSAPRVRENVLSSTFQFGDQDLFDK